MRQLALEKANRSDIYVEIDVLLTLVNVTNCSLMQTHLSCIQRMWGFKCTTVQIQSRHILGPSVNRSGTSENRSVQRRMRYPNDVASIELTFLALKGGSPIRPYLC